MKKICFLHTNLNLIRDVQIMLPEINTKSRIDCVHVPNQKHLLEYAEDMMKNGASVLVARGIEAAYLRDVADYPIVEVMMTIQEFISIIEDAKNLTQKSRPEIAVVGFAGSYSKISSLQKIMDVHIREYLIKDINDYDLYIQKLHLCIHQAVEDGADCILGGKNACDYAATLGIPSLFTGSSIDSMREAFRIADMIACAVEESKKNAAVFKAVVDSSLGALAVLNKNGRIVLLNYLAEKLLNVSLASIQGKEFANLISIPPEEGNILGEVLSSGKSYHSMLVQHLGETLVINLAPVIVDGFNEGAIISIDELRNIEQHHSDIYKSLYSNKFVASGRFEHQVIQSPVMQTVTRHAQLYAHYDTPILITGEIGSGKKKLAECIHNASIRQNGPFVALDCSTLSPDVLDRMLYGTSDDSGQFAGMLRVTNDGTLYLENICTLNSCAQQKLAGVLSDNTYFDPNTGCKVALTSRIRIICSNREDISILVAKGEFSPALYCALQTLTLHVPPLRARKEDIWDLTNAYISAFSRQHKKFVRLEEDVVDVIKRFSWPGNLFQLNKFCERLVVMAEDAVIDASVAEQLLPIWGESSAYDDTLYSENEADRILNTLKLHGGNRKEVSEEMGMSKTTLWRRMKQYGIQWQ